MASEWRVDVDSEGELGDVVATNPAYPDEIMVLAEFTDPADAARCVEAVNALPGLRAALAAAEARAERAEAGLYESERRVIEEGERRAAAEARAERAEVEVERLCADLQVMGRMVRTYVVKEGE